MPAYWIAHVTVTNPEAYGQYASRATVAIAAHGGEFGRPPIPEATRQPRLHLAGGSVLGSNDRRRHRAGLILVKLTQCVLTQSDASGKGA
mgnify:CR=1 FL=1